MPAIQHAQSAGVPVRLARTLPLELRDLRPESLDFRLRPLDAPVQARDLGLLRGQPAVDFFELGQERRLARARRRDAFFLLAQLLLRLLELALLGLQRIVAPGLLSDLSGGRSGRQQRKQHRERPPLHGSRPARASHPPRPPRSVPAPSSATTPTGVRNTICERPSVRLTSGSSRGATTECVTTSAPRASTAPASPCIMPWSSTGRRMVSSEAPTSRMISVSCRRACRMSVVAVVTVRIAAIASTAPTPRPIV